ncbi:MAG TPA: HEAT repeat domain-containing protein [Candidatus Ozemobacteraceae bacterium]|nr:HEAT repeat domain-containing protein [Candidatus Ozemobacteraceae bacterium]
MIILSMLVVLVAIAGIRFYLRRRAALRQETAPPEPEPRPETKRPEEPRKSFFEPPPQARGGASSGFGPPQESPQPAQAPPEPASGPPPLSHEPEGFATGGATPGKPGSPVPPARVAGPEELPLIIGSFSMPVQERLLAIRRAAELTLTEAVPTLIEVLYEPDPAISAAAAEALGRIGDPRGIEPLLEITHRNDIRLLQEIEASGFSGDAVSRGARRDAEKGEGSESRDLAVIPEANPFKYRELTVFKIDLLPKEYFQADGTPIPRRDLVMKGLKDNDQQLRKMAAKAAIGIHDPEVVPTLVEALQNPYEVESVRYLAAEALGDSGDERAGAPLLKALKDENVAVRYSAAAALSNMRDEKTVGALIEALNDDNEFVRSSVAYALGTIGDKRAMEALLGKIDDGSEVVRFSVGKALGGLGGEDVIAELDRRLDTANARFKRALIDVVSQIKNESAVELLRKALRDPDSETSYKASLALMTVDDVDVLDDLIEASRRLDQELIAWFQAQDKLGNIPPLEPAPGPAKPKERQSGDASSKFSSLQLELGGGDSIEKLEAALRHESPNVRGCAANALGDFAGMEAGVLLLEALNDKHEYVRSCAVAALGKRRDPETLDNLLKLQDPSEDVRYSVAKALPGFGRKAEIFFALNKMMESDPSRDVRRAARMSLDQMKKESEAEEAQHGDRNV